MNKKNLLFAALAAVILVVVGLVLFSGNVLTAQAQKPNTNQLGNPYDKSQNKSSTDFVTDGVFTAEDVTEWSPLPDHNTYLSVDQYASYCKQLQSSGRYSKNVYTNAFLSMKRYIAQEEVPVYDKFLKDAPTSSDARTIVMNTIASNWKDHPELNQEGDLIMQIAAACK